MNSKQSNQGFSLIELLIYVSIFAVVAGLMTSILITILKVSQKESASVETSEQLSFVMQTVSRLIRESSNIETATANSLKLRMKNSLKDPTCLYLENQTIKIAEGPDLSNPQNCNLNASSSLTSAKVIADKLEFSKISNYPGHDVVSIDIQLTYNSQNPQSQTTRALRSAIARVSAATFDAPLLPGTDNLYDIGYSPNTRWKNAAFSGDLLVNGNVGIGKTNPAAKLEVWQPASSGVTSGIFGNEIATAGQYHDLVVSGSDGGYAVGLRRTLTGTTPSWLQPRLDIFVQNQDTNLPADRSVKMTILNTGNVGIGTTTPSYKLDVRTADSFLGRFMSSGLSNPYVIFGSNNNMGDIRFGNDSSQAALINTTGGWQWNTQLNIMNGNVGIGETNPLQKLVVYGNGDGNSGITVKSPYGYRTAYFASDGSLNFNNGTNVGFLNSAGAWIDGSDADYKKNIQDIKYGLNDVLLMKPRAYLMKDTNISQIGFIAQEMRKIIPEAVSGAEGSLGISYGQLTSVLAKAIQEQQEQIEELKSRLEKLESGK